jgi:hypothetical protein
VLTTHALFARKVQRKLSNGVPLAEHLRFAENRGTSCLTATPLDGAKCLLIRQN